MTGLSLQDPSRGLRIARLLSALRWSTRLWYDVLVPATMLVVMDGRHLRGGLLGSVVGAVVLFHAGQTLFNDVADVAVDERSTEPSRHQRALVQGTASPRLYLAAGCVLLLGSFLITLTLPWVCIGIFGLALPLVLAYNFKPIRLSGRPLATQLYWPATWALMYLYCAGALGFRGWQNGLPYLAFIVVFMGIGEGLTQDIRDADNDAAGGRLTTVVRYGVARSAVAAWLAFLVSLAPWVWSTQYRGLPSAYGVSGAVILAAWLAVSLRPVMRLQATYRKVDGKLLHVGAIYTFTCLNLITVLGVLLGS